MEKGTLITEIMTKEVIALSKKDSLNTVEKLFKLHNIRHLLVVNKDEIAGIVTTTDQLKYLLKQF